MTARARAPIEEIDGLSIEEVERKAAGDIALLDDPEFNAYKWSIWRLRTPEEVAREPQGGEWEHVSTKIGQIDEEWARANLGGGTFEFRGYFDQNGTGRKQLCRRPIIPIAGPRKNFSVVAPPPPPTAAAPVQNGPIGLTRGERIMLRLMRESNARLDRLERAPAPAPPPPTSIKELAETMVMLDGMRNVTQPGTPPAPADVVMNILQKGIAIGEGRGPVDDEGKQTNWGSLIASALQAFTSASEAARIRRASPPPTANGHPPSGAEVVNDRSATLTADEQRWLVLLEALERAIRLGEDPGAVATALEVVLPPIELDQLRKEPLTVLQRLTPLIDVRYPSLKGDAARNYVALVISALQEDSEGVTVDQGGNADPP